MDKEFIENPVEAYEKLKVENFELKESLKCFQTPEAIKALTFYKTGEFELQEKKCIELEQENAELKAENDRLKLSERDLSRICQGFKKDIETEKSYTLKYYKTLQEIKYLAESKVKPNLVKRMNGTAMYGISKIIELTKAEEE